MNKKINIKDLNQSTEKIISVPLNLEMANTHYHHKNFSCVTWKAHEIKKSIYETSIG